MKYSFVCPVTTLFNDNIKTCDYWYNVNCEGGLRRPEQSENGISEIEKPVFEEPAPVAPPREPDRVEPWPERPAPEGGSSPDDNVPEASNQPEDSESPEGSQPSTTGDTATTSSYPGEDGTSEENMKPFEGEGPENQPDLVPEQPPTDGSGVPDDFRRMGTADPTSRQWKTFETTGTPTTTGPPRWKTFDVTDSPSPQTDKSASDTSLTPEEATTVVDAENNTNTEFRNENWMEQGMPSSTAEAGNESLTTEGTNTSVTDEPVSNVNRYSRGGRRQPHKRQGNSIDAQDNSLIGSMMKWAAAANSALSQSQREPKVSQRVAGPQYSEPKGPNPYVPYEERERRIREQRASHAAAGTGTPDASSPQPLPEPPTEPSLSPPYAYPYEPSANAAMANSGMHVSLNERKVYTGDRSGKGGASNGKRATSLADESVDHPNPWTFPMTDQEAAEASAAAKPRDTYRSRRRDDPNDASRKKGAPETGSAFDMMVASSSSTTEKPVSGTGSYISGVTESMPATTTTKPSAQKAPATKSSRPGNFIEGEVTPNGQCRCALPEPDVYFS